MPVPTQETDFATRIPGLLTSRYVNAPVVSGLAKALCQAAQLVENNFWSVLTIVGGVFQNGPPAGGPWDFLDKLGAIVGVTRSGRDDADFWAAILIQIAINTSNGHPNDFLRIAELVAGSIVPLYYEWPPAAFEIDLFDISASTAVALVQYMGKARPAAVAANLRYTLDTQSYVTWGYPGFSGGVGFGYSSGADHRLCDLRRF